MFPSVRRNLRFGGYEKTGCCVDKTTVAPTGLQECPGDSVFGNIFDKFPIECDVLGEACDLLIGDVEGTGMCIQYNFPPEFMAPPIKLCSCCWGEKGLVPEELPEGEGPPYGAVDPGTVLPMCPVVGP